MNVDSRSALRALAVFMLTVVVLLFPNDSVSAQTTPDPPKPASEVEQLKQRLQQLEQVVSDLKGQISALEETKAKTPAPAAVIDATYSEAPAQPPAPAPEKQQDGKGESTFTIYGFAMLDAGYQFKQNHPDWFDVIRPTKLPAFPNE